MLVAYAKRLGFATVSITTNGRLFSNREKLLLFKRNGLDSIIFSIHGHNSRLHDKQTRVKGSFAQLLKAIANAKSLGFKFNANVTISKLNLASLPKIARFIRRLGCTNAEFIFVDPSTGGAREHFDRLVPRLKTASRYILEALDIGRKLPHWHVRYLPLCYISSHLSQISELSASFSSEEHQGPEFTNLRVAEGRRLVGRTKASQCRFCFYDDVCEGIWVEYAARRGLQEIRPIRTEKKLPLNTKVTMTPINRKKAKGNLASFESLDRKTKANTRIAEPTSPSMKSNVYML